MLFSCMKAFFVSPSPAGKSSSFLAWYTQLFMPQPSHPPALNDSSLQHTHLMFWWEQIPFYYWNESFPFLFPFLYAFYTLFQNTPLCINPLGECLIYSDETQASVLIWSTCWQFSLCPVRVLPSLFSASNAACNQQSTIGNILEQFFAGLFFFSLN